MTALSAIPQKLVTEPRVHYRIACLHCGAVMVGAWPGDIVLAADRRGWAAGYCRRCKKAAA